MRYSLLTKSTSLNVQSYDGKLPSEIYEQYMAAWGKVNLIPEGVDLNELIDQLTQKTLRTEISPKSHI